MNKKTATTPQSTLYIRCTHDLWYRVSKAALDLRIDKNELIKRALEEYLKTLAKK